MDDALNQLFWEVQQEHLDAAAAIRSQSAPVDTSGWARRQLAAAPAPPRRFEERTFETFFSR